MLSQREVSAAVFPDNGVDVGTDALLGRPQQHGRVRTRFGETFPHPIIADRGERNAGDVRFVGSECGLGDCCELAEAPARADRVAHRLPSLAMTVEVAVREHHVRHVWTVGGEGDFDLAGLARVGFDLPVQVDVPAEAHKVRRFIGEHSRPSALAAVRGAVDDVAADVRFEDHLGQFANCDLGASAQSDGSGSTTSRCPP